MPFAFASLYSLVSSLFGPLVRWAERKQQMEAELQKANDDIRIQEVKNDGIAEKYESQNSMTRLKSTSAAFKYITFVMWFYPFIMGQFRPMAAKEIFDNLNLMPQWYTTSCVVIMFSIWGISVTAPAIASVFSGLGSFMQAGRDHRENLARINRDAVFNSLKRDLGSVTQKTVDEINRALDAGESQDDDTTAAT